MPRRGQVVGPPLCHPDRPYLAKGMCRSCYQMSWRDPLSEKDHVERGPWRKIKVVWTTDHIVPERARDVRQNAVTAFPVPACTKCRGRLLQYIGREARCFACGHSHWLVKEAVTV